MSLYIYAPAQAEIIESNLTLANIGFGDRRTALHTVVLRIMHKVWQGEGSLVVVPSAEDREFLFSILSEMGLGEVTLSVQCGHGLTAEDCSEFTQRIGRLKKHQTDVDQMPVHLFMAQNADNFSKYQARYFENGKQISWRNLLDHFLRLSPNDRLEKLCLDLSGLSPEFNADELNMLRGIVADARDLYKRDFELYRSFTLLPSGIRQDEALGNRLEEISHTLFMLQEAAEALRDRYMSHMRWLRFTYADEIAGSISGLSSRLHLLHADLKDYFTINRKKDARTSLAVSRLMHEFHSISSELAAADIAPKQHFRDLSEEMIVYVERALSSIDDSYHRINAQVSVRLKSINRHNTHDHVLSDLESDLLALVRQINSTQLFEKEFEVNTLSFKKQVDVVVSIVKKLENAHLELQKELPYYQWLEFLSKTDDKAFAILKSLQSFDPADWSVLFEAWYASAWLSGMIDIKYSGVSPAHPGKLMNSLYVDFCNCKNNMAIATAAGCSEQLMGVIKQSTPEMLDAKFKKDKLTGPLTWKSFVESAAGTLGWVFPILIIDNDEELRWSPGSSYQHLIHYGHGHANIELLQLFTTVNSWFEGNVDHMDYFLGQQFNYTIIPSVESARTQKLSLARLQTEAMLSLQRKPEIFGLKHGSIISFAGDLINLWLKEQLYDLGIKYLTDTEDDGDILTAVLLEQSGNIFLITEDDVFNPKEIQTIIWQYHLLDCVKNAGLVHLNVDTALLYRTNGASFQAVVNHIRRQYTSKDYGAHKQLSFDFV